MLNENVKHVTMIEEVFIGHKKMLPLTMVYSLVIIKKKQNKNETIKQNKTNQNKTKSKRKKLNKINQNKTKQKKTKGKNRTKQKAKNKAKKQNKAK